MTDANLVLGRLDPDRFFGGKLKLDLSAARRSMACLGRGVERVAEAVLAVANSNIERALRVVSLERGYDVREFWLVAFGGAGPLHAAELAASLGLRGVLVPRDPGNFCARGALLADVAKERSKTVLIDCSVAQERRIEAEFRRLIRLLASELNREGFRSAGVKVRRSADLRYRGQSHELIVPWSGSPRRTAQAFERLHEQAFGFEMRGRPIEVVAVSVRAVIRVPRLRPDRVERRGTPKPAAFASLRYRGRSSRAVHYERDGLGAGASLRGPAVVHESNATTFLPPGSLAWVDEQGNMRIAT